MNVNKIISWLRLRVSLLQYIWKIGEINRLHAAPVMLVCGDGDRGVVFSGKKYAQLLDSINDRLIEVGIATLTVSLPFSELSPDSAYGNAFSVNGLLARASVKNKIRRLIAVNSPLLHDSRVEAWSRILDKVQPKRVIGIQPPSELCIAAQKRYLGR